jgi:6-pyruvoyl-tetrahydropterin synthase
MAIYEITVEHAFRASHAIQLADDRYEEVHEHLWQVEATFRSGQLDHRGMVVDFLDAMEALKSVTADLEGTDLSELPETSGQGATAEVVAEILANRLVKVFGPKLYRLCLTEAPGCKAAFCPGSQDHQT